MRNIGGGESIIEKTIISSRNASETSTRACSDVKGSGRPKSVAKNTVAISPKLQLIKKQTKLCMLL